MMYLKKQCLLLTLSLLTVGCVNTKIFLNIKGNSVDIEVIQDLSQLVPLFMLQPASEDDTETADTTIDMNFEGLSYEQKVEKLKSLGELLALVVPLLTSDTTDSENIKSTDDLVSKLKKDFVKYMSRLHFEIGKEVFMYKLLLKDVPLKELNSIFHDGSLLNIHTMVGRDTIEIYLMGLGSKDTTALSMELDPEPMLEFEVKTNLKVLKHNAHSVKEDGRLLWKFKISDIREADRDKELLELILFKD